MVGDDELVDEEVLVYVTERMLRAKPLSEEQEEALIDGMKVALESPRGLRSIGDLEWYERAARSALGRMLEAGVLSQGGYEGMVAIAEETYRCPETTDMFCFTSHVNYLLEKADAHAVTDGEQEQAVKIWRAALSALEDAPCSCPPLPARGRGAQGLNARQARRRPVQQGARARGSERGSGGAPARPHARSWPPGPGPGRIALGAARCGPEGAGAPGRAAGGGGEREGGGAAGEGGRTAAAAAAAATTRRRRAPRPATKAAQRTAGRRAGAPRACSGAPSSTRRSRCALCGRPTPSSPCGGRWRGGGSS